MSMLDFFQWLEHRMGFGYHITPLKNLNNIKKHGLIPNYKPNWIGKNSFGKNSELGVFFTIDPNEIHFWMEKYTNPILLKFQYDLDEVIGLDSHAPNSNSNFIIPRKIQASEIQLWDGKKWTGLTNPIEGLDNYSPGRQKKAPYPRTIGNLALGTLHTKDGQWASGFPKIDSVFPNFKPRRD